MSFPRTPKGIYNDINKRFFDTTLPVWDMIDFSWVEHRSQGEAIDTRCDLASIVQEGDRWKLEVDIIVQDSNVLTYFLMGHEMLHIKVGMVCSHKSKEWRQAARQLQGKGFFLRIF